MAIKQYESRETFTDLEVTYGGQPQKVTVEFVSSGTTGEVVVTGIGRPVRLVLERESMHVLSGVFTRSLNNSRRANKLRAIGSYTSRDEVQGWGIKRGNRNLSLGLVLEVSAATLSMTVTGLPQKINFDLDPEDIRMLTWFLSKALYNVKMAQRIRAA